QPRLRPHARPAGQPRWGDRAGGEGGHGGGARDPVRARGRWVCNEKRLIEAAGLPSPHALFGQVPSEPASLVQGVELVAGLLGAPAGEIMPWSDAGRGTEPSAAAEPARR